ncbi:FtsX-like permease family protein [Streptomyces violaceochromogenes]|uniref:FtsX-like permease family protein n=1 Tax=Streptomyces violaceochromogenes TaxID=67377 RepID=A0ABU6M3R3_9ACTN|nr:FtsX-like permease family protein [Streptomyces violaceochromogenes]MEC7056425.1 FtsX-like permease family protein [Streptomyces violaceochromogenes]GHC67196.1 membrane protein [Streptomyces violaceochromogenes]
MSVGQWSRDLGMGARFALAGGREGWTRALLTAVGVGLGVALLLLTTAIPGALAERDRREEARSDHTFGQQEIPKADDTLIVVDSDTTFRDRDVRGRMLEAEGPKAPLPPGVPAFPADGEMVVSPALKELLASGEGKLLRERLDYRITGTIGEQGLVGSQELAYYAGGKGLAERLQGSASGARIDSFGNPDLGSPDPWDPVLLLLVLVVFVVLLMPVAVFIAAAVRFGGERRDRRLAALRLVGSDSRMTRRIAAGEALAGSVLGLVLGTGFFLLGRQLAASVEVFRVSVFPSYLNPSPLLAVLVALAVPAAAVLVTILALRGVVIEPLGVVRTARPARRRLWWRLLLPLGGLALLYPMMGQGDDGGSFNQYLVVGGVMLLLIGVTALLPWVVETVVARLGSGGVAWQLAVRRLQLSSGVAARMVNGIAVAVAGAIALQMLFAGVEGNYTRASQYDVSRAQMSVDVPDGSDAAPVAAQYRDTEGIRKVTVLSDFHLGDRREADALIQITVADCASLREVATLPDCRDGDVFAAKGSEYDSDSDRLAVPGTPLWAESEETGRTGDRTVSWTVPRDIRQAESREDPTGYERGGILITPGALPGKLKTLMSTRLFLSVDPSVPDAYDHVRNTAARLDPTSQPMTWHSIESNDRYAAIRTGLSVGAACVLALIGASLLVSQLEQLRERRKLLSSLVAFGTRRRTLGLSVLWQTAIPIGLGLLLAAAVGMTLGAVLLRMTNTSVRVDWPSVLSVTGIGAGVVLVVTLLSLPPLMKLMRPDGLRTE